MTKQKILIYSRNLLFLFLIVYNLQGVMYGDRNVESDSGHPIAQLSLFAVYAISGVFMIKTLLLKEQKSSFFKIWTMFLILNLLWYVFTGVKSLHFGMFKGVLISLLALYPFYYFRVKGVLKEKHFIVFFLVMLPIYILKFYLNAGLTFSERAMYNENLTNNVAYSFVALIPFVFFFRDKRVLSILASFVLMLFIIQGAKRGALLVGGVGFLMFVWYQLSLVEKRNRWRSYFVIAIGVAIIAYYAIDYYLQQEYLINRMVAMTEGDSSLRDVIYKQIWEGWYNSDNLFRYLFGYGFGGSRYLTNNMFAHNDWLELLSNMGLLGVVVYLMLFYSSTRYLYNPQWTKGQKVLLVTVMSMWFATTIFSMGYMAMNGYMRAMVLGYLIGGSNKELV